MPGTNPGTTGLISWWSLDEASGQRNDSHGTNHLTDNNTVLSAAGKVGNAADFEAGNLTEKLNISDNASLSTGDIDFSIALWVNFESLGTYRFLAGKSSSGTNREWELYYDIVSQRLTFFIANAAGAVVGLVEGNTLGVPSLATWYFLVCWHDAAANTVNMQINNGTVDSAATTGVPTDTNSDFSLGLRGAATAPHDGLLDEVPFAKKVYTADERTWLYNAGAGRAYSELAGGLAVPVFSSAVFQSPVFGGQVIRG